MNVFLNNRYTNAYYRIIERRRANPYSGYTESHHIVPESFFIIRKRKGPSGWLEGDADEPSNLVNLTAKEHFICHWLLVMMTEGIAHIKMMDAIQSMKRASKKHKRYQGKITARVYAALKEEYALIQSERVSGENNPMAGDKFYRSEEGEARRQLVMTGDKNPAKRPEVGKAISDSKTGVPRGKFSDEWSANLSASRTGEKNHMFGKEHKDDTRALMSEQASDRTWIKKGMMTKRVKNNALQSYLDDGWEIGRIEKPRKKRGPYKKKQTA